VVTLRYLLSVMAAQRGMIATFMPKPFADRTGSGLHLHLSLTSQDVAVFHTPGAAGPDRPDGELLQAYGCRGHCVWRLLGAPSSDLRRQ
jgi:glutamine synthetase